ncbi:MAG: hypothetical protein HOV79_04905 [Hamadaea sp.]|nr:hypothetical protein [Hamadaea sp.]
MSDVDDTLRILLRDLAKESAKPTIRTRRAEGVWTRIARALGFKAS